jgi:hypothetical protein
MFFRANTKTRFAHHVVTEGMFSGLTLIGTARQNILRKSCACWIVTVADTLPSSLGYGGWGVSMNLNNKNNRECHGNVENRPPACVIRLPSGFGCLRRW